MQLPVDSQVRRTCTICVMNKATSTICLLFFFFFTVMSLYSVKARGSPILLSSHQRLFTLELNFVAADIII